MSIKKYILWITMLILIDQIIKVIINNYFLESNFTVVPFLIEFRPVFNPNGVTLLNLLNLNIKFGIYFIFGCLFLTIVFCVFLRKTKGNTRLFDFAFIFAGAGLLCSMISCIFWARGCLDYIHLKPLFFIVDIKDLYLICFGVLFIIFLRKNRIRTFKELFELTKIKQPM